jgi:hypothetical protein
LDHELQRLLSFSAAAVFVAFAAWGTLALPFSGMSHPQPVSVTEDSGGEIIQYLLRTAEIREGGGEVRIEGRCDSACTLFLSLPRDQLCLTENAYFRFHLPLAEDAEMVEEAVHILMMKYPEWVKSWISANKGLTQEFKTMDFAYARQFVRTCEKTTIL